MDAQKRINYRSPYTSGKAVNQRLQEEQQKAANFLESQSFRTGNLRSQQAKQSSKMSAQNVLDSNVLTLNNALATKSPTDKENNSNRLQVKSAVSKKVSPKKSLDLLALAKKSNTRYSTPLEVSQTELNATEYVARKNLGYNNVSDLIELDSITLENSDLSTLTHSTPNLSFNIAEITGRSTLLQSGSKTRVGDHDDHAPHRDLKKQQFLVNECTKSSFASRENDTRRSLLSGQDSNNQQLSKRANQFTVDEILATSFSSKVHEIRKSLINMPQSNLLSTASVVGSPSPTKNFDSSSEFSFFKEAQPAGNVLRLENYTPGELFKDQLINDEMEWAQAKKAMPTANFLSQDVQRKLNAAGTYNFNSTDDWSSMNATGNDEFSAGEFFQVQSADLSNMLQGKSPKKDHTPFTLISDDSITTTANDSTKSGNEITNELVLTTAIDDRTYNKSAAVFNQWENKVDIDERKDSGNGSAKIDQFNFSAIRRYVENFTSSACNAESKNEALNVVDFVKRTTKLQPETEKLLKNKENIEALNKHLLCHSDNLSFADPPINKVAQNQLMSSVGQPRSLQSPVPSVIAKPQTNIEAANNEVIYSTDIMLAKIRKSFSSTDIETAENQCSPSIEANSTLLNSPHFQKSNKTLTSTQNYNHKSSSNKHTFDPSPLPSSRSCLSAAMYSPFGAFSNSSENLIKFKHNCNFLAHFDYAKNSEQRFISSTASVNNSNADLRHVATSPSITSEASAASNYNKNQADYSVPPIQTFAFNSVKSNESNSSHLVSHSRASNKSVLTHFDGPYLPLKVTLLELAWGSIPLHKSSQKSLQIRNISNERLAIRIKTSGPGFQLASPGTTLLTLSAQECRRIVINFCATMTGTAVGKLSFQLQRTLKKSPKHDMTASNSNCHELAIPLYAYGGHASISIQNILVGPINMPFFPIGDVSDLFQSLEGTFQICNKGPLLGFALFEIETAGSLQVPDLCRAFKIEPQYTLIAANNFATIHLVFTPSHGDIKKIKKVINEVLTLAKIRIVYGDEAMRQRLRQVRHSMSANIREKIFTKSLEKLWQYFPGENTLTGLDAYKDESSIAYEISSYLTEKEVAITLNNNAEDETVTEFTAIFDDEQSLLFRTFIDTTTPMQPLETVHEYQAEAACDIMLPCRELDNDSSNGEVISSINQLDDYDVNVPELCSVTPKTIYVDFWAREEIDKSITVIVHNNFGSGQYFSVTCSCPNLLYLNPTHGYIPIDGQIKVEVRAFPATRNEQPNNIPNDIFIMFHMERQKIRVPVCVIRKF